MSERKLLLEVKNVNKQFNGIQVLHDVCFDMTAGEVHALMGENGAGKSTIIKIITGVYTKDSGDIYISGEKVEIHERQDARRHGVSVIYQELSLIPALTVTENIFLGQELTTKGLLKRKEMRKYVAELIEKYEFELSPDAVVDTLGMAQRQMVEILKALSQDAKLIIMDEPTSSLSASEQEKLFETIDSLRKKGASILYISHRLEEVYRLSDRLTVMRDGRVVGVLRKDEIVPQTVTTMMIGKEVIEGASGHTSQNRREDMVLEVKNLSYSTILKDVSFKAYGGEILGIGGLVGSGRTELISCIYGARKQSGGTITFNGKPVSKSIIKNIKQGFALVPEDRRNEGFVPGLSTQRNLALPSYDTLASAGLVSNRREVNWAQKAIKDYDIRPAMKNFPVGSMSGGNQQKTVIGRWLARNPKVLLLDEPTVGIDVGVKSELYRMVTELADAGAIVIVVSSDLPELVSLSDRILVMHNGSFFEEFTRATATQQAILLAASGVHTEEGTAL